MKYIDKTKYVLIKDTRFDKDILFAILLQESFRWSQNLYKWFKDRDIEFIYKSIYGDVLYSKTNPSISKVMYDFCKGVKFCKICGKECKFFTFAEGYYETCGDECCYNKLNSILRVGDKNPSHRMSNETRLLSAKKQSIKMKKLILEGRFTPCITNSWANSRCKLKLDGCNYLFRSTWEAMFWLLNKIEYEKIRIPYKDKNNISHVYIVDFVDEKVKCLYEIKPSKLVDSEINKLKYKSAVNWCAKNGYTINIISEDYFRRNKSKILRLTDNKKIVKALNNI